MKIKLASLLIFIGLFKVGAQEKKYAEPLGKKLILKTDCKNCHAPQKKFIGPSYAKIAEKYENSEKNVVLLSDKVINGSKGVWGNIPMTAHPKLNKNDAAEMIKYILSAKY